MSKAEVTKILQTLEKLFPKHFEDTDPLALINDWHQKLADQTFAAVSQSMWELIGKTNTMPTPEEIVQNIVPLDEVIRRTDERLARWKEKHEHARTVRL